MNKNAQKYSIVCMEKKLLNFFNINKKVLLILEKKVGLLTNDIQNWLWVCD